MLSLYAQYLTERTNDKIIETSYGFATYRYLNSGKTVYIIDIYVKPAHRLAGNMATMADKIIEEARAAGAIELIGTVVPSAKGSTNSLKALLGYGMELAFASNDLIVFRKDIV